MKRIDLYRQRLAVEKALSTFGMLAHAVDKCTKENTSEKMFDLCQDIYSKHFVDKMTKQEYGCFVAFCVSNFEYIIETKH